jgi:AcrR family transcriptional regulator
MTSFEKSVKNYHHGNLGEVLVDVAREIVKSGGAATFSLRDAARQAGVTPGAVYKHFDSKDTLLAAVAVAGFEQLAQRVALAVSKSARKERLSTIGLSYVTFAIDEPHLFNLMFGPNGPNGPKALRSNIVSPPGGIFDALQSAIAEMQGVTHTQVKEQDLALAWATAHGAARLVNDGLWKNDDPRIHMSINAASIAISQRNAK